MDGTRVELNSEHEGPVRPLTTFVIASYLREGRRPWSGLHVRFAPRATRPLLLLCPNLIMNPPSGVGTFPLALPVPLGLLTCQLTIRLEGPAPSSTAIPTLRITPNVVTPSP